MAVLFLSSGMRRSEHQVRQIVWELGQGIEIYRSLKRLSKRFDRPRGDMCVMLFLIRNHKILNDLILIKDQMYDLPIALILPDSNRETILKGHKFYPRFITFFGSDYSDLILALYKIINRENKMFNMAMGEVVPIGMG